MKVAFFGLPLGALGLQRDGHEVALATLSPVPAPGARRLARTLPRDRLLCAQGQGPEELGHSVETALRSARPDLLVSWYWTRRIPVSWLRSCGMGGIGAHPSLLPRHRGPNPFFWSIDCGDEETGASVHWLEEEYDTGRVIAARALPVGERNSWQLARALDRVSLSLLRETVLRLCRGEELPGDVQDETRATAAPEPTGELLRWDRTWTTERLLRRIRALSPVPGLALDIRGVALFVTRGAAAPRPSALRAGEASVWPSSPRRVVLATADAGVVVEGAVLADSEGELSGQELAEVLHACAPESP